MTVDKEAKVAVIGVGRWGAKHLAKLAAILGEGRVAFYEVDEGRRRAVARECPAAVALSSWEEFLAGDWPAAVIAAPAARHAALARAAIGAGKDLLVEKPLALTAADAADLVRLAEERGTVLMVGHILLFDPAFAALAAAVSGGELGAVKYVAATRAKLGTVRTEEDVLFSLAAHDVAAALSLIGTSPTSASAVLTDARGAGVADAASLNLTFEDGVAAYIWASWLYPVATRRFVVVGDRAMAVWEQRGPSELAIYRRGARPGPTGPAVFDEGERRLELAAADSLEEELKHFLACVRTRARPRADGRQGAAVVKVLAAAQKSARAAGAPVRLEGAF